ncbi:MAG: ATP-dependent DNA helicase RecG [Parcubacteria bacterium OLB19]|nr:MAG: ATP-dependent DNA helicase RecG [Parcubacteria bacterium OLB19]
MNLQDTLTTHFRLGSEQQKALKRLGLVTIENLLFHLPVRYENISDVQSVGSLVKGQEAVVYGQLTGLKTRKAWKSKVPIGEAYVEDGSAKIKVMWFNQPYIAKMYQNGVYVKLAGKVAGSENKLYLSNPEVELLNNLPIDRHDSIFKGSEAEEDTLYPIYRETKGITSKWFYHAVIKCFEKGILDEIVDPLPTEVIKPYNLPEIKTALVWIHTPKKITHAESARKRFAFQEVFYIQVQKARERAEANAANTYKIKIDKKHLEEFTNRFPFALTEAQTKAIEAISDNFVGKHAMSRLLEGDVGSGKTAVAATTAYAVATSRPPEGLDKKIEYGNLQVAYMAPTEILAKQHFLSFIEYFKHLPIQIGLLTSSGCQKFPSKSDPNKPTPISKTQLLKWVKNGEIPILIGTHALIYKSVEFKHLAYVIIDEQHRFGTNQRKLLAKKDNNLPHLLSMTATPIPRTLALTIYGDLDITLLDQMPSGRKPVITEVVGPGQSAKMYEHVKAELKSGRQAYVICPRIEEPDPDKANTIAMKNVATEAERLGKEEFAGYKISTLHSKMSPAEKDKIMKDFSEHKTDILVATSVVEVGVNVPNATNIIIEGAERFGLSQLHQLRGRVIRGTHQAYCFAVTDSKSDKTKQRLKALTTAKNGFELSEYDLQFRGSGELYGQKQSGLSDLGMEAIKNLKLVEAARNEAQRLISNDATLESHPLIARQLERLEKSLHME